MFILGERIKYRRQQLEVGLDGLSSGSQGLLPGLQPFPLPLKGSKCSDVF